MSQGMSAKQVPLTLIVAATKTNGIGKNGSLPWPMLKKEMGYFARVTKRVPGTPQEDESASTEAAQNVVIMGRKTWDSIPPTFRPLKDRTSIVITTQAREKLSGIPDNVVVASDILTGLESLEERISQRKTPPVGRAFVIGGSSIYAKALELPQAKHILLTRIHNEYDCDTFFPADLGEKSQSDWQRKDLPGLRDFVGEEVPEGLVTEKNGDDEIRFEFQLYEMV